MNADVASLETLPLATRAELHKLAQLLGCAPDTLTELGVASTDELRSMRQAMERSLFEARADRFTRLARLTRLLPARLVARLAMQALGPLLSARIVARMDPYRARHIARHITPDFVAELAPIIDPASVQTLVPHLPAELVRDAALLLVERRDFVTMGRFGDALSPQALRAVIQAIDDDGALLRTAFMLEKRDQLSRIIHHIDNKRIARIMQHGAEARLLPEALFVIDHVNSELKSRLADLMGAQDESVLDALVAVAREQRLWGPILRGMSHMHPRYRRKIVNLPSLKDAELLGELVRAAFDEGLLAAALPLARVMRPDYQRVVAHAALQQGEEVAEAALEAAHASHEWATLLALARHTDSAERDLLASLQVLRRPETVEALLADVHDTANAAVVLDIVARMDEAGQRNCAQVAITDGGALLELLLDHAEADAAQWEIVARVLGTLDDKALSEAARILARRDDDEISAFRAAADKAGVWQRFAPLLETAAA